MTRYIRFNTGKSIDGCNYFVKSKGLRLLGSTLLFYQSDSSLVKLRLLGEVSLNRTGYNSQNTDGVLGAGFQDQAPGLLKANGARSMTPKRSRQQDSDYFRVGGSVS